jgi:hypothetical protein
LPMLKKQQVRYRVGIAHSTTNFEAVLAMELSQANQTKYAGNKPRWWHDNISDKAIAWIEEILDRKVVTLFAEFGSDGLLNFSGDEFHAHYLPIDEVLLDHVYAWGASLRDFDRRQEMSDEPIDWTPFADEGYRLAVALKGALPDWTINYADQLLHYKSPDGNFCPEILPDGGLGPCLVDSWKGRKTKDMTPAFVWPKPLG